MTTHENRPASEQPDWAPTIGVLCGGCGSSSNYCHVVHKTTPPELCCSRCSHSVAAEPTVLRWEGDDG